MRLDGGPCTDWFVPLMNVLPCPSWTAEVHLTGEQRMPHQYFRVEGRGFSAVLSAEMYCTLADITDQYQGPKTRKPQNYYKLNTVQDTS